MLCQLSYTHHTSIDFDAFGQFRRLRPILTPLANSIRAGRAHCAVGTVARQKGLEPLTHGLEGRCSIHLSYWRDIGASRFERPTPCSQGRCATRLRHAPSPYRLTYQRPPLNSMPNNPAPVEID